MRVVVTGGAGFIGRWVVKRLLELGHRVVVLDDLSSGSEANLKELATVPGLALEIGDIKNTAAVNKVFAGKPELCLHLAASINVQDSLDDPGTTFANDVGGTFNVLEACRLVGARFIFMSTCMVYAPCQPGLSIAEDHLVRPASPYAGAKLAGEHLALSYYYSYRLPVVILRPFNTYGPYQKTSGEGGVISIFLSRALRREPLLVYGDGNQTRDFLYVEDCAEFVVRAALSPACTGQIINAGSGRDLSINELAAKVVRLVGPAPAPEGSEQPKADCPEQDRAGRWRERTLPGEPALAAQRELKTKKTIEPAAAALGNYVPVWHVKHIHPQSEIAKLCCNYNLAAKLLGWQPQVGLEEGLRRTWAWIAGNSGWSELRQRNC